MVCPGEGRCLPSYTVICVGVGTCIALLYSGMCWCR